MLSSFKVTMAYVERKVSLSPHQAAKLLHACIKGQEVRLKIFTNQAANVRLLVNPTQNKMLDKKDVYTIKITKSQSTKMRAKYGHIAKIAADLEEMLNIDPKVTEEVVESQTSVQV